MHLAKQSITFSVLACALSLGVIGNASAAEDSATFQVRLVIQESCTISATQPTDIDFLSHVRSTGAPATATGTLTVNCSAGTPYSIGLSGGANTLANATAPAAGDRRMASGSAFVPYDLYRDGGFSNFWGNTAGVDMQTGTGNAANQAFTVHGRVPSTNFPAGSYTDSVTARVVY
ncbi:spore coat U domain-containing protein [Luteimonas sp. MC1572]|uniref:Csu type fimbrial protein n=1 Tax=Luteimonas sp. MC1572 TaxID=2799325 RepID=UPI0018F07471|nr:spore coat U domain-containing protein [Luteimonas sp. MC1572]MBJ6980470.1 spore coat protein U domain-containing protein [Luteimonas sp. MC1572]QQO04349.1 spore coat protein U domain-containing protein [Luteimonas sp. MC1572]